MTPTWTADAWTLAALPVGALREDHFSRRSVPVRALDPGEFLVRVEIGIAGGERKSAWLRNVARRRQPGEAARALLTLRGTHR